MRLIPRLAGSVLLLLMLACRGGSTGGDHLGAVGEPAPAFRLAALGGGEVDLSDYRGRVVLLDFWATWCKPCHEQARILAPLYEVLRGEGVEFLAIDSGEDAETVQRYVAKNPFPYPVLLDPEDSVGLGLGVVALPTVVIVDTEGRVTYANEGIADAETLRRELERVGA